jgi:hypothetical protein
MIARELRDNFVPPSARRASTHRGVALGSQLRELGLGGLHLPVQIDAPWRPAKRPPEQEHILVAVGAVRIGLRTMELRIRLPHVIFNAGELILPGVG